MRPKGRNELPQSASELQVADYGRLSTEREVLRALWGARNALVRSEIHRRMPYAHRPTLGRVGQILKTLHSESLLVRQNGKAQGSRKAGFYALSDYGKSLCRRLGFERDEKLLFSASQQLLVEHLTRERLSWEPPAPGRIITTYSFRGGIGRTTMVAHVARGLAEGLPEYQSVLVIDLDLGASGLDEFFPKENLRQCRGLGGLLVDYERLPEKKRSLWLHGALRDPLYALQPTVGTPNLVYLPSGVGSNQGGLSSTERAEALSLLQAEAATTLRSTFDEPSNKRGFLEVFREALLGSFARTVIDSAFGNNLGAWVATLSLADELMLCMDYEDTTEATISGLQAVLANFISRYSSGSSTGGGLIFLFRLKGSKSTTDLERWIERHLLIADINKLEPAKYRIEQLHHNVRLRENRYKREYTGIYKDIIGALQLSPTDGPKLTSPEEKALVTVLDPKAPSFARSLSGGILEKITLQEFARLVDWHANERHLPAETDAEGKQIVRSIVESHSRRLLDKILLHTADTK